MPLEIFSPDDYTGTESAKLNSAIIDAHAWAAAAAHQTDGTLYNPATDGIAPGDIYLSPNGWGTAGPTAKQAVVRVPRKVGTDFAGTNIRPITASINMLSRVRIEVQAGAGYGYGLANDGYMFEMNGASDVTFTSYGTRAGGAVPARYPDWALDGCLFDLRWWLYGSGTQNSMRAKCFEANNNGPIRWLVHGLVFWMAQGTSVSGGRFSLAAAWTPRAYSPASATAALAGCVKEIHWRYIRTLEAPSGYGQMQVSGMVRTAIICTRHQGGTAQRFECDGGPQPDQTYGVDQVDIIYPLSEDGNAGTTFTPAEARWNGITRVNVVNARSVSCLELIRSGRDYHPPGVANCHFQGGECWGGFTAMSQNNPNPPTTESRNVFTLLDAFTQWSISDLDGVSYNGDFSVNNISNQFTHDTNMTRQSVIDNWQADVDAYFGGAPPPPPPPNGGVMPTTIGRSALHSHHHLYRDETVFDRVPNSTIARQWALSHDMLTGQWRSGETEGLTNGGFTGLLDAGGLFQYPGGARAEPDMVSAHPSLLLALYYNGTLAEGPKFGHGSGGGFVNYFPPAWYRSTTTSPFGNYDMSVSDTTSFTTPNDDPYTNIETFIIKTGGWSNWAWKYSVYMMEQHPAGLGVYTGVYWDIMTIVGSGISVGPLNAHAANAVSHLRPLGYHLTTNSIGSGINYFSTTQGSQQLVDPLNQDMANMEFFLKDPPDLATAWPTQDRWERDVSALIDIQRKGVQARTTTKLYDNSVSEGNCDKWRDLCVCSALFGNRTKLWLEFVPFGVSQNTDRSYPSTDTGDATTDWQRAWNWWDEDENTYPIYGGDLGGANDPNEAAVNASTSPTRASLYQVAGQSAGVYRRVFNKGVVLVNLNNVATTAITIPAGMVDQKTGVAVVGTTVTVPSRTGRKFVLPDVPTNAVLIPAASLGANTDVDFLGGWSLTSTTDLFILPRPSASLNPGDVLFAHIASQDTSVPQNTTAPAGWAKLNNAHGTGAGGGFIAGAVYYKVIVGTEPVNYTFRGAAASGVAAITAWRGMDTTALDGAAASKGSGGSTSPNTAQVATVLDKGGAIYFISARTISAVTFPNVNWQELYEAEHDGGDGAHRETVAMAFEPLAVAAGSGGMNATLAVSSAWAAFAVAIDVPHDPPPPPPPPPVVPFIVSEVTGTAATAHTITLDMTQTGAGHLLTCIVEMQSSTADVVSITDDGVNTNWKSVGTQAISSDGNTQIEQWYTWNALPITTVTITISEDIDIAVRFVEVGNIDNKVDPIDNSRAGVTDVDNASTTPSLSQIADGSITFASMSGSANLSPTVLATAGFTAMDDVVTTGGDGGTDPITYPPGTADTSKWQHIAYIRGHIGACQIGHSPQPQRLLDAEDFVGNTRSFWISGALDHQNCPFAPDGKNAAGVQVETPNEWQEQVIDVLNTTWHGHKIDLLPNVFGIRGGDATWPAGGHNDIDAWVVGDGSYVDRCVTGWGNILKTAPRLTVVRLWHEMGNGIYSDRANNWRLFKSNWRKVVNRWKAMGAVGDDPLTAKCMIAWTPASHPENPGDDAEKYPGGQWVHFIGRDNYVTTTTTWADTARLWYNSFNPFNGPKNPEKRPLIVAESGVLIVDPARSAKIAELVTALNGTHPTLDWRGISAWVYWSGAPNAIVDSPAGFQTAFTNAWLDAWLLPTDGIATDPG